MKKKINIKLVLICLTFLLFVNIGNIYSQFDNIGQECGTVSSGGLTNIPVKTPGSSDYLRCLVIYITFPDDNDSGYNYTIWKNRFQTSNPRPVNPYSGTNGRLIDSLVGNPNDPFMTRYHNYTLSDYFCEMSMGQYDVIGDEIAITLPRSSLYYRDTLNLINGRGYMNRYILNYLDSTRDIDWSRYDNWSFDDEWKMEPDGTAKMILMNYRTIPNNDSSWFWDPSYGGEASLAISSITFGTTTIGSDNGITALNLRHAFCPDGKGLYVYREGSGCSNLNQPYDVVTSEGRFNWTLDRNVTVPLQNYHHYLGGSLPILKTVTGSRYNGR